MSWRVLQEARPSLLATNLCAAFSGWSRRSSSVLKVLKALLVDIRLTDCFETRALEFQVISRPGIVRCFCGLLILACPFWFSCHRCPLEINKELVLRREQEGEWNRKRQLFATYTYCPTVGSFLFRLVDICTQLWITRTGSVQRRKLALKDDLYT